MPFPFIFVCDLLAQVEKLHHAGDQASTSPSAIVSQWFKKHRLHVDHPSTDISALFSTLLPEKRTDRVYGIQEPTLHKIIGRALSLGISRLAELRRYELPGSGRDLADCVANILTETPNPSYNAKSPVTIEEIDSLLHAIASTCRFSSAKVRSSRTAAKSVDKNDLGTLYRRINPIEAKWLTRLVLKAFGAASMDPGLVYKHYDERMPLILQIQDNFDVALESLRKLRNSNPLKLGNVLLQIKPILGNKVGRQDWLKGRSIKHCIDMSPSRISCEKKMDGEYCQIHVDLSKGHQCIQIFSKSAKDSTQDRVSLHTAIRESLRLGRESQTITKGCILEGEMVVYNDRQHRVLPFDKIRKYVTRSGHFIGVEQDSPPNSDEHLMIVYFDVLLIDNESLLGRCQTERFDRLKKLITCRTGYAELVPRQVIDLDEPLGASHLRKAFAQCIAARGEGLVLKPNEPYFNLGNTERKFASCPIKLKKEYVKGFGDIGDFAVVGARYDPAKAKSYRIPGLKWTHFFLGCLTNKEAIQAHQAKPCFTVIDSVEINESQLKTFMLYANPMPVSAESNNILKLHIPQRIASGKGPSVVFSNPPVFDIMCFSFTKQGNTGFWTPRFPQVSKIHFDRDFMDSTTFSELQLTADESRSLVGPADSQEMQDWIAALEAADPRGRAVDAHSQLTASSAMTPSPRTTSTAHSQPSSFSPCESPTRTRRRIVIHDDSQHAHSQPFLSSTPRPSGSTTALNSGNPRQAAALAGQEPCTKSKRCLKSASIPPLENKRQKVLQGEPLHSLLSQQTTRPEGPPSQDREPLSAISVNASPVMKKRGDSQHSVSFRDIGQQSGIMASAPAAPASVLEMAAAHPQSAKDGSAPVPPTSTSCSCRLASSNCLLRNRDIILSPCVAGQLLITEDFLPAHGITSWVTDPQDWAQQNPAVDDTAAQQSTPSSSRSVQKSTPERRRIKVCFVETLRDDATRAFIDRIESLDLRLPNGEREFVEVYDWRGLQAIHQSETLHRGARPEGKKPLMQSFVGLV